MIIAGFGVFWSLRAGSDPRPLPNNAAIIEVGLDQRVLCYLKVWVCFQRQSIVKKEQQTCGCDIFKGPCFRHVTANGKRQFIPRHHAFPLIAV